jgi:hypothetical protein
VVFVADAWALRGPRSIAVMATRTTAATPAAVAAPVIPALIPALQGPQTHLFGIVIPSLRGW